MKLNFEKATEKQLRNAENPSPKKLPELVKFIETMTKRKHDYGTCVYAMSLAAVAAFNYVASQVGSTGFQAGCADLDFLKRTRNMERFRIVNLKNLLYPQYRHHFDELRYDHLIEANKEWLAKEAKKLLKEPHGADTVREHWERLAKL